MTEPISFRDLEQQGWETETTAVAYDKYFADLTMQSIPALLDATRVRAGMRVLDVATGGGYVADAAVKRGAGAVGVDFSSTQIALAQKRYPGVEFHEGDAEALPFGDGDFDAVVMNLGILHLPHPDAALQEAFRVLRRGGRFAFTAWASPEESTAFAIVLGATKAHANVNAPLPPGPNFFQFSDSEHCRQSLLAAGFVSPIVTKVPLVWRLPSADSLFAAFQQGTVRFAASLRAQTPEALEAIRAAVRTAASAYDRGGTIELSTPVVLAAAAKP